MLAGWYEKNGAARDVLQVGDMAKPEPGPNEVLVRMHASGVNPSDVKSRRGRPMVGPLVVPHSDGAGIIEAVGKGVDHSHVGQRVYVWNAQYKRPLGTAAQYCALPVSQTARLPRHVDYAIGACIGIPLMTAIQAVRLAGKIDGKTILVTGAGSSVGHYAVQIARAQGARVIGTASEERAPHAREAGAAFVVDYRHKDVAKVVKDLTQGHGVDGIIDMDFSTTAHLISEQVMAPHSTAVIYGSNNATDIGISFPAMLWNSYGLKFFLVYELKAEDRRAVVAEAGRWLEQGGLRHSIGPRFSLRDIAAAHEAVEDGRHIGNVVIDIV